MNVKFMLNLSYELTIGEPSRIQITSRPAVTIYPNAIRTNIIWPLFILLDEIKVAEIPTFVKCGKLDACNYSSIHKCELPNVTQDDEITVLGEYTGMIPMEYKKGFKFLFTISFIDLYQA